MCTFIPYCLLAIKSYQLPLDATSQSNELADRDVLSFGQVCHQMSGTFNYFQDGDALVIHLRYFPLPRLPLSMCIASVTCLEYLGRSRLNAF